MVLALRANESTVAKIERDNLILLNLFDARNFYSVQESAQEF
jgi:hypothetical protein